MNAPPGILNEAANWAQALPQIADWPHDASVSASTIQTGFDIWIQWIYMDLPPQKKKVDVQNIAKHLQAT